MHTQIYAYIHTHTRAHTLLLHTQMNIMSRAGTHTPTHTHVQLLQSLLQLSSARVGCSHGGSLFTAVAVAGGAVK